MSYWIVLMRKCRKRRFQQYKEVISVYIPEFVCGIFATVIAEIAAAVAWYIYDSHKKKR